MRPGSFKQAPVLALAAVIALPALALAQPPPPPTVADATPQTTSTAESGATPARRVPVEPPDSRLKLEVTRVHHKRLVVGNYVKGIATLRPWVKGEKVKLTFQRNGHVAKAIKRKVQRVPGRNSGRVTIKTPRMIRNTRYRIIAIHHRTDKLGRSKAAGKSFHLTYPTPHGTNRQAGIFNDLLNKQGYGNAPNGNAISDTTRRAVLAFRKVNGMARTTQVTSDMFRALASGKGEFHPRYPGKGRHVEVDISRQVMVLIAHRKAQFTYHVSTGAPATPTVRGHFHFYSKQPGYNSHGMYYSVYFHGGYATHGYASVPTYNASHGCVRNPIPDSRFIYDWIHLGDSIWVYG